ncbi:MAG: ACT domain-containing protein [Verrucomicrobia bacterium]|nr:ACT domain-containing protein [Verrucomicrobiota bacterium]
MSLTVTKVDVWAAEVEDSPGGLAKLLSALAGAGANLDCVIARRDHSKPGKGVAFLTPVKGTGPRKAAKTGGLAPAGKLTTLRIEGDDEPGLGSRIASAIAEAGVNLHGLSGMVMGRKFVAYISVDQPADAAKTSRALKALAAPKKAAGTKRK